METNFDLSVKDWRGNVIGYRCIDCGAVRQQMWGNVCNECREKERRHRELIAAIPASGKVGEGNG